MPSVPFPHRLVFDKDFFDELKTNKVFSDKPHPLIKLMYINDRSAGHNRCHNVMSKNSFDLIIKENKSLPRAILRKSFYDYDDPELEMIKDDIERNIKIAIDLLKESPNQTIIFTSEKKEGEYKKNKHYANVKEIDVRSGKEAKNIIDSFFNDCICR